MIEQEYKITLTLEETITVLAALRTVGDAVTQERADSIREKIEIAVEQRKLVSPEDYA